jgi:hypothetical protein
MTRPLTRLPGPRRRRLGVLGAFGVAALSLAGLGCPGSLDPSLTMNLGGNGGGGSGGTVCDAPTTVFLPKCAMAPCHDAATKQGGLDLTATGIVGRLLDVTSDGTNGSVCAGDPTPYLMSGSMPATGLLLDKIFANPLPCGGGGSRMPQIGTLSNGDNTCINAWATAVTTGAITQ